MSNIQKYKPKSVIFDNWNKIENYKMSEYNVAAFKASVFLAIQGNKEVSDCCQTQEGQQTVIDSLAKAATTGLSLNPLDGKAALVAYKGKCTYQIMTDGLVELAMRSGKVKYVDSGCVRENDNFRLKKTTSGDDFEFEPALKKRGRIIGYYAAVTFKEGKNVVQYFSVEEMLELASNYAGSYTVRNHLKKINPDNLDNDLSKIDSSAHWIKSFHGMAKTKAVKHLFKSLYISDEIQTVIKADEQSNYETFEEPTQEQTLVEVIRENNE